MGSKRCEATRIAHAGSARRFRRHSQSAATGPSAMRGVVPQRLRRPANVALRIRPRASAYSFRCSAGSRVVVGAARKCSEIRRYPSVAIEHARACHSGLHLYRWIARLPICRPMMSDTEQHTYQEQSVMKRSLFSMLLAILLVCPASAAFADAICQVTPAGTSGGSGTWASPMTCKLR